MISDFGFEISDCFDINLICLQIRNRKSEIRNYYYIRLFFNIFAQN
jgi:hypothetical protein